MSSTVYLSPRRETSSLCAQANIDILEASKSSNKEEIRRLRAENKDIRQKLLQLVRSAAHGDEVGTSDLVQGLTLGVDSIAPMGLFPLLYYRVSRALPLINPPRRGVEFQEGKHEMLVLPVALPMNDMTHVRFAFHLTAVFSHSLIGG